MSSFKSSENLLQKKERGPAMDVSNTLFSSVTLNKLAMKARERELVAFSSFIRRVDQEKYIHVNPNSGSK